MQKYLLFFLTILLLSFACSTELKIDLKTIYPDTSPYYIGTTISEISIDIINNNKNINKDYNVIEIVVSDSKYLLKNVNNKFSISPNYTITSNDIKDNFLTIKVVTPIEGLESNTYKYRILDPNTIFRYSLSDVKDKYNKNQDFNFSVRFDILKSEANSLSCYVKSPTIADNSIPCNLNNCSKVFGVVDKNGYFFANILCFVNYNDKQIPQSIIINTKISDDLNITLLNPDNNVAINPFYIKMQLKYPNGLDIESNDIELYVNGIKKNVSVDKGTISYNKLLLPYSDINENILLKYRDNSYYYNISLSIVPAYWFYLIIALVLVVVLFNIAFLIYKYNKKDNLDELIAQRDIYSKKLSDIKVSFSSLQMTKSTYDELSKEYQMNISNLNSNIVKMKGSIRNNQLNRIDDEIRSVKPSQNIPNLPPQSIIDGLKSVNKDINTKELSLKDTNNKTETLLSKDDYRDNKRFWMLSKIFSIFSNNKSNSSKDNSKIEDKKTLDDKIKELKNSMPVKEQTKDSSKSDDEFDVNSWKK